MNSTDLASSSQYLTFRLAEEVFAFDITKVREVLDFATVTKVPNMPGFMRGVINLRGDVVPVVDLRLKFGLPATERTVDTCIIIAEVMVDDEPTVLGALADSVQEVMELDSEHKESAPKIGTWLRTDFIKAMGKRNDNFVIVFDVDKIFSSRELSPVHADRAAVELTAAA